MPIVLRHEAAGIPAGQNPNRKYGQSMVLQQQQADQNMRLRAQDAQYDMQRIGAMAPMRKPSLNEESSMLDQEIRSGLYEPDKVKALRNEERLIGEILRDKRLDATMRASALEGVQSRIRMMRATGRKMQPVIEPDMQGVAQPSAQPPRTAQAAFRADPKLEDRFMALVNETPGSENMTYEQKLQRAIGYYNERERALADPSSQSQGQPAAQQPNAPAPAQGAPSPTTTSAMPPGSFTGGVPFGGISPVLAQGGFQQSGVSPYNSGMNTDPKGVAAQLESYPPKFRLNDGSVVGSVLKNGQWVPETQSSFGGENGGQAMGSQVGGSAYQPTGDINVPTVYGASPVLANTAQQPQYPMEAVSGMQASNQPAAPSAGFTNARRWVSNDGKFSTQGQIVGFNPPSQAGGYSSVRIQKTDGAVVDVPLNRLSQQDQQFALSGGNPDTMYALQNPGMSAGLATMDPNNPVRQQMSAADQSIVNPQKQTLGKPGGRYGLGMIDYGTSPATGNRVTASIRPGGTMPEYDEPIGSVGPPGTAMAGRKGSVTIMGGETPAADNALTKLLATMTPSQRRDYSKWLMEEPDRYAMRNEIAQQQLNQNATAKGSGQLPTYPGKEARKQQGRQQGQAPVQPIPQGQPMQGQPPQAQGQSQPPKPAQQPPVKLPKDDKRVQEAMGIATNPYSTMQQLLGAASILAQSDFTEADIAQMEKEREAARAQSGSVIDTTKDQKGRKAEVIDESVPPQQPAPSPTTPAERAATAAGNVAGAVGRGASAVAQTPVGSFLQPIVTGARTAYDAITGGSKYSSGTAKPSQKTPTTSPKAVASQPADGEDQTRSWTNEKGVPMFDGKLESISEPITVDGTQTRTVTLRDSKGNAKTFDIGRFSQEDQNFLMTQYNIGIAKNAWPEKDFWGRYGSGEPTKYDKKGDRPRKQSMNPKTSGYDENRRVPNPEYRQKGEKSPTARKSQAKRTG